MNQHSNEHTDHTAPVHQIIADGKVIYTGKEWTQAFLAAGQNPELGEIIHVYPDGEPGARWGPPRYPTH